MQTFVLIAFHPCVHETAGLLLRRMLGPCRCGLLKRPRTVFCAVRAEDAKAASIIFGNPIIVLASSRAAWPEVEAATYYDFKPLPATAMVVSHVSRRPMNAILEKFNDKQLRFFLMTTPEDAH